MNQSRARRRLSTGLLVTAMIGLWGTGASSIPRAAATTEPSSPFNVMTFNYSGANNQEGIVNATNNLQAEISAYHPKIILVQEMCQAQYNAILTANPSLHGDYYENADMQSHDGTSWTNGYCDPTNPVTPKATSASDTGQAMFSTSPWTSTTGEEYTAGSGQAIMCGRTTLMTFATEVCNTQLSPGSTGEGPSDRATQIPEAVSFAEGLDSGVGLILGGDFNEQPNNTDLNGVYYDGQTLNGSAGTGAFQEADECTVDDGHGTRGAGERYGNPNCNQYTARDCSTDSGQIANGGTDVQTCLPGDGQYKIDYIFFRQAYFNVNVGGSGASQGEIATGTTYSDHYPLVATSITACDFAGRSFCDAD
jgi:endonuclease/exonuclease/phosphatase family metal-dependent hydrolase